jgi:hypothetical protein
MWHVLSHMQNEDLKRAVCQLLTSVILPTRETEIRRILVPGQPGQKVHKIPSQQKKTEHGFEHLSSQLLREA